MATDIMERFDVKLPRHHGGLSHGSFHCLDDRPKSGWANLPANILFDVIRRLEKSESTWPERKHVVACASVCRSWRGACKKIVTSPEFGGKLTFPDSLKEPGYRDGVIQCFIKRDKSKSTYHLFLTLCPDVLNENGKFLLAAKRIRKLTCNEYVISTDADNISTLSNTYIGKLRSNILSTKFEIHDTQPPQACPHILPTRATKRRFYSKKVSPKEPTGSYNIAQIVYKQNVLGVRAPRRMQCIMHSIPSSSLEDPSRSISFSKSHDQSTEFDNSSNEHIDDKTKPLVLKNNRQTWHEKMQCWVLNFHGRCTIGSIKNFQMIKAGAQLESPEPTECDRNKMILQFGKVGKDMFTMDYRYPFSAFQAFAICLSSFDTKMACE